MTVYVQSKCGGVVSQVFLHSLDVIAALEGRNRVAVPIGYNKDKPDNPLWRNGLTGLPQFFFYPFSPQNRH